MAIDRGFLIPFADALQSSLIEKLGLSGENAVERCKVYAAEHAHIAFRREGWLVEKSRLESIRKELLTFAS